MSLIIDSNTIKIQNAGGDIKFDSTNGLLYRTGYFSGSVTLSDHLLYEHGLDYDPVTDLAVGSYTITACSGNIASSLIGNKLPMSVPVGLHVEAYAALDFYGQLTTRPTYLSFSIGDTYLFMNNKKIHTESPNAPNFGNSGAAHMPPAVSVSLNFELTVYKATY